ASADRHSLGDGGQADLSLAYSLILTVTGSVSRSVTREPRTRRTSLPRVASTTAVPPPPPAAAPIAAPFLPPTRAPMTAPPAAGAPISSASFFFVAGAVRPTEAVRILYRSSSPRGMSVSNRIATWASPLTRPERFASVTTPLV